MTITMAKRTPAALPAALLALLMAPQCGAAEWKFIPAVELREIYTDNVRLEADALAQSQFISDLAPSLSVAANGPRLKLSASLIDHLYAYSNRRLPGTNRSQRQLTGNGKATLVDELLYLDANGSIAQRAVSAFGPQVADNGYAGTNRTEVSSWRISPYLAHRFGAAATAEMRYARDAVKTGNTGLGNSSAGTVSTNIASGPAFHTIGWGLQASHQDLDSARGGKSTQDTGSGKVSWRISDMLSVNANRGYDKYDYKSLAGPSAGPSYSLGLDWTPSLRTRIQASAGKRYFGNSYLLNASHRSRHAVLTLGYNDAVTTTRGEFLLPVTTDTASMLDGLFAATIADPVARQQAVDAYIRSNNLPLSVVQNVNYFSNRYVLQKQLRGAAAFNTAKTTTVFSLNGTRRTALSAQETDSTLLGTSLAGLNDNTKQMGAEVLMSYRLSPISGATLMLTRSRTESLSTGIRDDKRLVSLGMTHQFAAKLKGVVELHHSQGNVLTLGGRAYRENAVSATLSYLL